MEKSHFSDQPISSFVSEHNLTPFVRIVSLDKMPYLTLYSFLKVFPLVMWRMLHPSLVQITVLNCFLYDLLKCKNQPQTRQKINYDNINSILSTIH